MGGKRLILEYCELYFKATRDFKDTIHTCENIIINRRIVVRAILSVIGCFIVLKWSSASAFNTFYSQGKTPKTILKKQGLSRVWPSKNTL